MRRVPGRRAAQSYEIAGGGRRLAATAPPSVARAAGGRRLVRAAQRRATAARATRCGAGMLAARGRAAPDDRRRPLHAHRGAAAARAARSTRATTSPSARARCPGPRVEVHQPALPREHGPALQPAACALLAAARPARHAVRLQALHRRGRARTPSRPRGSTASAFDVEALFLARRRGLPHRRGAGDLAQRRRHPRGLLEGLPAFADLLAHPPANGLRGPLRLPAVVADLRPRRAARATQASMRRVERLLAQRLAGARRALPRPAARRPARPARVVGPRTSSSDTRTCARKRKSTYLQDRRLAARQPPQLGLGAERAAAFGCAQAREGAFLLLGGERAWVSRAASRNIRRSSIRASSAAGCSTPRSCCDQRAPRTAARAAPPPRPGCARPAAPGRCAADAAAAAGECQRGARRTARA